MEQFSDIDESENYSLVLDFFNQLCYKLQEKCRKI